MYPPGLTIRLISRNEAHGNGMCSKAWLVIATSKLFDFTGIRYGFFMTMSTLEPAATSTPTYSTS